MRSFFCFLLLIPQLLLAQVFNVLNFGAIGDSSTVNTVSIQAAIDSCAASGGGTVLIPQGNFVTGTIFLKDKVMIEISDGGTLQGSTSIQDYPDINPLMRSYTDGYPQKSIIYAENVSNVGITGEGTLDGNGLSFLNGGNDRPFGMRFISCTNVLIENLKLRNSGFWMMHNMNIDTLTIRNINIYNHSNSNNDGINVDGCRNVLIENCTVDSNDDPLVFKATAPINCENIIARKCTLATWSRAIKIGTETMGGFRNIQIADCVVLPSSFILPPISTATCGINLAIVDGGFMEDVTVENVNMESIETPILIRLGNQGRKYTDTAPVPSVGSVNNITLRNITATAQTNITSSITGIPGYSAQNITLDNIQINFPGGESAVPPGFTVPENESGKPNNDIFGQTLPAYGLYIRHVQNIKLDNVCFTYNQPDERDPIVMEDVTANEFSMTNDSSNTVCLDAATSIGHIPEIKLEVYPDYANSSLILKMPDQQGMFTLFFFDLTGRLFKAYKPGTGASCSVQIGHFPTGIYVARLVNESGTISFSNKFFWK